MLGAGNIISPDGFQEITTFLNSSKVCGTCVVTLLSRTPILSSIRQGFVIKNKHQVAVCYDRIALCCKI